MRISDWSSECALPICALLTFAIVGGGPTGVELAGTLAEIARHTLKREFRNIEPREARVLLLEAGPRVLSTFPDSLSEKERRQLEKLGVEVRTGTPVNAIDAAGVLLGDEPIARSEEHTSELPSLIRSS